MGKDTSLKGIGDFLLQTHYDQPGVGHSVMRKSMKESEGRLPKGMRPGGKGGVMEEPRVREKRKAREAAVTEKRKARERIKPMPDPEATRTAQRRGASRRRQQRGGRASTVLSAARETLG